eukprot:CAMPEP_0170590132 /NCGR_PEP_ID=MMETSP0224-20130122/11706_1 /TAXON_ID=285029 /ORGANISM="Togula jolla, Strain CCCM 725" /LENGTH=318 /DNA_ID=CAMNT_0010913907 /DNA_START=46 /DNA_END=1002 /DNA_ORIENTATION=-
MATTAEPINVSVPTSLGSREVVDLSSSTLNFQLLENPQVSLQQCATKFGPQLVRSIFEKLAEKNTTATFEVVNLSDDIIGDEGARYLQQGFAGNKCLKQLLLPRAGLTAPGFHAIGDLIGDCPSLVECVLSSNVCDAEGVKGDFDKGLKKNKTLKSLYMAGCRLGDEGIAAICPGALSTHPALEHVSLAYNRLEHGAALSLNKMLHANMALRYLDLSGNALGPQGAKDLVVGLKENKGRLQKLSVAQNTIRLAGTKVMVDFFTSPEGKNMEFLDLRHNYTTYKGMVEIRAQLKRPLDEKTQEGWLLLFGTRQLFINAH